MEVAVEDFEWQLRWLGDNRHVVDLDTAIRRWDDPLSDELVVLTFDDGYKDTYTTAFPLLREREMPFTMYIATESISNDPVEDALSWPEIVQMHQSGLMTSGAHTHTHRDLRFATPEEVEYELETSDLVIEQHLGQPPRHFTYPWGYWSSSAHDQVSRRYDTATVGAPVGRTDFDLHVLHRYPIQLSDGTRWFEGRLRGGYLAEERVRRRLRGYRGP